MTWVLMGKTISVTGMGNYGEADTGRKKSLPVP